MLKDAINLKKKTGLTNEAISALSGIPKSTIAKITSGAIPNPKPETLKAIAKVLGFTLDEINEIASEKEPTSTSKSDIDIENGMKFEIDPQEMEVLQLFRTLDDADRIEIQGIMKHMLKKRPITRYSIDPVELHKYKLKKKGD